MAEEKKFNIRVYGLLLWENRVLVTDEWLWGKMVTKFPGGGLEWGEGIADCLQREFREELSIDIVPGEVFYINDFFQVSAYHPGQQVISIYYRIATARPQDIEVKKTPFEFDYRVHGEIVFRWVPTVELNPSDFHFPIDKVVAEQLTKNLAAL